MTLQRAPRKRLDLNIHGTMMISKGEHHLQKLTLVDYILEDNQHIRAYIQHNKNCFPTTEVLCKGKEIHAPQLGYKVIFSYSFNNFNKVVDAVGVWDTAKIDNALSGFSWLHGYLFASNIDIYREIGLQP